MSSYLRILLVVCACVAVSLAQFNYGFDYGGSFLPSNFGGPHNYLSAAGARDPRANTGPVVFPPSPPGDASQTSGVVAGASGYGFVPPGSQAQAKILPLPLMISTPAPLPLVTDAPFFTGSDASRRSGGGATPEPN